MFFQIFNIQYYVCVFDVNKYTNKRRFRRRGMPTARVRRRDLIDGIRVLSENDEDRVRRAGRRYSWVTSRNVRLRTIRVEPNVRFSPSPVRQWRFRLCRGINYYSKPFGCGLYLRIDESKRGCDSLLPPPRHIILL